MLTVNKRVLKDIQDGMKNLQKEFGIYIAPEETDFYKVHFILPGPEDTPFEGGLYHGMIRLNNDHPIRPPNIHMITPNGRFSVEKYPIANGSRGICTTATSFHPESWTPMNNIETVLKGFISLMCDPFDNGVGAVNSTPQQIKKLAIESINHLKQDVIVKTIFTDLYEQLIKGTYMPFKLSNMASIPEKNNSKNNSQVMEKKSIKSKNKISDSDSDSDIDFGVDSDDSDDNNSDTNDSNDDSDTDDSDTDDSDTDMIQKIQKVN
ncbi:putative ubiquitin-conjugating enzyme E2 [Megavirus courdo7]|uniref:E2 ubiquitin-conjugating enzyme n=1 Tax=Megavirus courdo7 TaxID=1128135 RepID=H2EAD0_9VIRU|nr:putative ubiquitin-conjugating enzyme E2 [Megavirus courdo7]